MKLSDELRQRADWLESRTFASLDGDLERRAADELDKLSADRGQVESYLRALVKCSRLDGYTLVDFQRVWLEQYQRDWDKLPKLEDVELAILANGGPECCQCDPEVGHVPCMYCAVADVLRKLKGAITNEI